MSKWLEYASQFEEGPGSIYFEIQTAYHAQESIQKLLDKKRGEMIFLLGEPGSGKSFMLQRLYTAMNKEALLFETPVSSPLNFLNRLVRHGGEEPLSDELEALKEQAEQIFRDKKCVIMLDEAQLLDEQTLEYVRILCDTRSFWVILAMHEREGKMILEKSHFKSRPHSRVELGALSVSEAQMYMTKRISEFQDQAVLDFHHKHAKRIHRLSMGNFRYLKKLLNTEFSLLHEAYVSGMKGFSKPSKCLLNMAAIEIGVLDV